MCNKKLSTQSSTISSIVGWISQFVTVVNKLTQKTCSLQFVQHTVYKQLFILDAKWKAVIGFNEVEGICKISKRAKNWIILSRCRGALH